MTTSWSELSQIEGVECRAGEGTFYAFPRSFRALWRPEIWPVTLKLVELLINEADVACVPGSAFGAPGYIRLSYACSMATLEEALGRIKRAILA